MNRQEILDEAIGMAQGNNAFSEPDYVDGFLAAAAPREELIAELVGALKTARVGLFHEAPESCWATGPSTGDDFEDLVVCPGCRGIHAIDAALAKAEARQ